LWTFVFALSCILAPLAILHTGIVFIGQEVAVWFQAVGYEKVPVWHTVPYSVAL